MEVPAGRCQHSLVCRWLGKCWSKPAWLRAGGGSLCPAQVHVPLHPRQPEEPPASGKLPELLSLLCPKRRSWVGCGIEGRGRTGRGPAGSRWLDTRRAPEGGGRGFSGHLRQETLLPALGAHNASAATLTLGLGVLLVASIFKSKGVRVSVSHLDTKPPGTASASQGKTSPRQLLRWRRPWAEAGCPGASPVLPMSAV